MPISFHAWWQPIETAPKDGGTTYVILYDKHVCVGVWFEDRWKPIHSTETIYPTHWMPLPPKPEEDDTPKDDHGIPIRF